MNTERQQVLQLWLAAAALDTSVVAWAFYDGSADTEGISAAPLPDDDPPYRTGVSALRDGWMLLQAPGPLPVDRTDGDLGVEFIFQRTIAMPAALP